MHRPTITRALAIWLLIMLVESFHGMFRTIFLVPMVGDFPARQIGVFTGSAIIFAITWFSMPWLRGTQQAAPKTWWAIGVIWVVLTLVFEILLGRALALSWQRIIEDYNPAQGGLMGLGMAAMLVTPWVVANWRKIKL